MASVNAGSVKVSLIARMQQWASGIRQAETRLDSFARKVEANRARIQATGRALTVMGAAITGLTVAMGIKASNAADQLEAALLGLSKVAEFKLGKEAIPTATQAAKELADDGLITVSEAALGLKNLLLRGFGLPEAIKLMSRFKDTAAFGRQAALSMGQAVVSATEGLKNENSILVDNAGVTKNVSVMWKEYARVLGKGANSLTQAEKIQAEMNGIMAESEPMLGNAAKLSETAAGSKAKLRNEIKKLWEQIGQALNPVIKELLDLMAPVVGKLSEWVTGNKSLTRSIVKVVGALGLLKLGLGLGIIHVDWLISGVKHLTTAVLLLSDYFKTTIITTEALTMGMGSMNVAVAKTAVTVKSIVTGITMLSAELIIVGGAIASVTMLVIEGTKAWKEYKKASEAQEMSFNTVNKAIDRFAIKINEMKKAGVISHETFVRLGKDLNELKRLNEYINNPQELYRIMAKGQGADYEALKEMMRKAGVSNVEDYISTLEGQYQSLLVNISKELQYIGKEAALMIEQSGETIGEKLVKGLTGGTTKAFESFSKMVKDYAEKGDYQAGYAQFKSGEGRRSMVTRGMGALSDLANKPTAYLEALAKQLELYDRIAQKEQLVTIATLDSYDQRRVAADMYYQALSDEIRTSVDNETVRTNLLTDLEKVRLQELANINNEQIEAQKASYGELNAFQIGMVNSFVDNFSAGIQNMFNGSMSFMKSVKSIWKGIKDFVVQMIAEMTAKWLAFAALTQLFNVSTLGANNLLGTAFSALGGAKDGGITRAGGIISPLPAMATGGITLPDGGFPAILHPNELVAPLDKLPRLFPESYAKTSGKEQQPIINNNVSVEISDVRIDDDYDIDELAKRLGDQISRSIRQ